MTTARKCCAIVVALVGLAALPTVSAFGQARDNGELTKKEPIRRQRGQRVRLGD